MLPPSLRGYAPEVNGVADSNATVIISQQGRILYQTQVPAGPFSIQDLNSFISGLLDVEIREQNGQVKKYQVATASLPYLTRPGAVRYKLTGGRPSGWDHAVEGPFFTAGEASWGITNGWSLYGGMIGSDDYQSLSAGIGRDLYLWVRLQWMSRFHVSACLVRRPVKGVRCVLTTPKCSSSLTVRSPSLATASPKRIFIR